jgi:hypothetical protein
MSRCAGHQVLSILCRRLVIGSHLTDAGDITVRHVSLEYAPWNSEQLLPSLVTNGRHSVESQLVPLFCVVKRWNASITERFAVTAYFCQHKAHSKQELLTTREVVGRLRVFCKSHSWKWINFRHFLRQTSVIRHLSAVVYRQKYLYSEHC